MGAAGRTVLVTGANSGIGLATALELARRGFRSVGSVRGEDKAAAVEAAAAEAGVDVETVLLDVTDAQRCREVVDDLRPWGLVNNAGFSVTGAIEDVADAEVLATLDAMAVAPMRLARLALPHMREGGGGRIVNMSSIYGRATSPLTGWYQAAKHALEAASDAMRMEVARDGVAVVLVEPGGIRTGIWAENEAQIGRRAGSRFDPAYRRVQRWTKAFEPLMADPGRVARVVAKALSVRSPRARYLVGPDARGLALADTLTPTALKDRVTRLTLGL